MTAATPIASVEINGHPRACRWRGTEPQTGIVLRSRRRYYIVMAKRSTASEDFPFRLTLGPISPKEAARLVSQGALLWSFAWDRK